MRCSLALALRPELRSDLLPDFLESMLVLGLGGRIRWDGDIRHEGTERGRDPALHEGSGYRDTPDGREILFASRRALWRFDALKGGTPARVPSTSSTPGMGPRD